MKRQEFVKYLLEELGEFDPEANENTTFKSLEFWDSMSSLVLIAAVDSEFSITFSTEQINKFDSFRDIIEEIGADKFE